MIQFARGILAPEMGSQQGRIRQVADSLQALGQEHPEIVAIYLFGSEAKGRAGPLSDLDVALLLEEPKEAHKRDFMPHLLLVSEVTHACRKFDVDVVMLNEATPLLAYEVIHGGQLLYEADHNRRVEFEARAIQHYLDLVPLYRVSRSYLKRQLLKTG